MDTLLVTTWETAELLATRSLYGQLLIVLAGLPLLVIALNVLQQLVS